MLEKRRHDAWLCENEDEAEQEEEEAVELEKEKFSSQNGVNQTAERQLNNLRKTDSAERAYSVAH